MRSVFDDQQLPVFKLVAQGQSSTEIATVLQLDKAQVDRVIRRTCRQLDVSSRHAAAAMLARHYDWPLPGAKVHTQPLSSQIGSNSFKLVSETAATKREPSPQHLYVEDVERPSIQERLGFNTGDDFTNSRLQTMLKSDNAYSQRLLVIALLLASGALALCALVAAMQGYNVIMGS